MTTNDADHQLQENNDGLDDPSCSSDYIHANRYIDIQKDIKELYSSVKTLVVKEEFQTHIKKDAYGIDTCTTEEQLTLRENDVTKTECPIVIAGETSCGKSSIINLIIGQKILPTSITASTSRVCRVKHSESFMISTRDREDEEIERLEFKNSIEMAETLKCVAQTNVEEISYVDVYLPVPLLQGNVMIVDTPGCGDKEQSKVADRMMSYLPNALAFVFVLNVPNAGGIQDDRLIPVLSKVDQSLNKMVSFSPKDVIFLLNKWDTIAHEDVRTQEEFFETSKTSLRKNWDKVDDSCIFKISATKVAKGKPKYSKEFDLFLITLKKVIAKNENKRVEVHLRYLSIFLDECNRILSTKLKCANTMAEKNTTDLDESSRELEKLEETRKEELSNIERNIDTFLDEASNQFHRFIIDPCFKEEVLQDTEKFTRFSIGQELSTRIENETKAWLEKHINNILEKTIMADLIKKFEIIQHNLHSIKDNLKGFKTPFDVDKKIAIVLASSGITGGASVIGSFLLKRIISHPGVLIGIATIGILGGVLVSGLRAFEVVDDFQTVRDNAFQARIDVFTVEKIKRTLKEEYVGRIKMIIRAFLEGDLEKEIIKIKENIKTMQNCHEIFKSEEETLSTLQSTVVRALERLHQIEDIDIKPE